MVAQRPSKHTSMPPVVPQMPMFCGHDIDGILCTSICFKVEEHGQLRTTCIFQPLWVLGLPGLQGLILHTPGIPIPRMCRIRPWSLWSVWLGSHIWDSLYIDMHSSAVLSDWWSQPWDHTRVLNSLQCGLRASSPRDQLVVPTPEPYWSESNTPSWSWAGTTNQSLGLPVPGPHWSWLFPLTETHPRDFLGCFVCKLPITPQGQEAGQWATSVSPNEVDPGHIPVRVIHFIWWNLFICIVPWLWFSES